MGIHLYFLKIHFSFNENIAKKSTNEEEKSITYP